MRTKIKHGMQRSYSTKNKIFMRETTTGADTADLRLIHVTTVGWARSILQDGQINVRACKVFNKDLVYFFLLRSAYKKKNDDEQSDILDDFPFVFAIDPEQIPSPYHVYPLDTGGAASGAFDAVKSPYYGIDDYALMPSIEAAIEHMDWAFASRADYFDGQLRKNLAHTIPAFRTGVLTFLKIAALAQSGHNKPDKRASAVEFAYDFNISLKDCLQFAILPHSLLEDKSTNNDQVLNIIRDFGIRYEMYTWHPNTTPSYYHDEISKIMKAYLTSIGAI